MGFKIPAPSFTPKLKTGTYNRGLRVERWQPDQPREGYLMPNFGMGWERSGSHGTVKPTRLEARKFEKDDDYDFYDDGELFERATAGAAADNISQLRKHLARKGTKFEPTGSVSNSPYDLKGGDLGVPSYGVTQRGRRTKKELLREARKRAKIRQSAGSKGGIR